MPTGENRGCAIGGQRGFTYLALLLWLALGGVSLAALGVQWSAAAARERERELVFRGGQIREAIARYWAAQVPHELPPSMAALLVDRRGGVPRHHLRRLFRDPFASADDADGGWQLITDPVRGGLTGVASRRVATRYLQPGLTRFVFVAPAPVDDASGVAGALASEQVPPP